MPYENHLYAEINSKLYLHSIHVCGITEHLLTSPYSFACACACVCVCVAETRSPRESRVPSEICPSAGMYNCSIMFDIIFDDVLRAAVCVTFCISYLSFCSTCKCPLLSHISLILLSLIASYCLLWNISKRPL